MTAPLSPDQTLHLLTEHLGAAVCLLDTDFSFQYVNAVFAQAFDRPALALLGHNVRDLYGDADFAAFSPYLLRALAGNVVTYERVGRLRDRHDIWRTVSLTPWRDVHGKVAGIVMASLAVHELMVTTESLRAANQRLSSHMDNSPLTVFELDGAMCVTRVSNRVEALLGLAPSAIVGRELWSVLAGDANDAALSAAFLRLHGGQEASNRVLSAHRHANGSVVHGEWFNSVLMGSDGKVASLMCLVEDRTERVQAQEQLRLLAMTDPLTQLPNRVAFSEKLKASLSRAVRSQNPVVVLYLDLDGFKTVNDNFGHASGDEVLREVAMRLQKAIRDTDTLARIGGDEFVVLLDTEVQATTADRVCSRIFSLLEPACTFGNGLARIGASIGVAQHPPLPSQVQELLARADAAMYEAKRAGKGCVRHAM